MHLHKNERCTFMRMRAHVLDYFKEISNPYPTILEGKNFIFSLNKTEFENFQMNLKCVRAATFVTRRLFNVSKTDNNSRV